MRLGGVGVISKKEGSEASYQPTLTSLLLLICMKQWTVELAVKMPEFVINS